MRVSDYARLAVKDISRQPIRAGLTILALAISTVVLVTLLAITIGARRTLLHELGLTHSLEDIIVTPNQSVGTNLLGGKVQLANETTAKLDDTSVTKLRDITHVASVDPRIALYEFKTFKIEAKEKTFVSQATGITTNSATSVPLRAGHMFDGATSSHEVVLGYTYAQELGYDKATYQELIGKKVSIVTQNGYRGDGATIPSLLAAKTQVENFANTPTELTATIVGVSSEGNNQNQLLLPMGWARQIKSIQSYSTSGALTSTDGFDKTGYSSIIVKTDTVASIRAVSANLDSAGYNFISTQDQIDRINSLSAIIGGVLGSIAIISLITACLGIANTMLMTISEQRFAIGVWRAVGARKYEIAIRFIVQACLLGLIGGICGALIGYGVSRYTNNYISRLLEAQNLPAIDVVQTSLPLLAFCVVATVFFAVIAGLYPAWRAAREDPSSALSSQ